MSEVGKRWVRRSIPASLERRYVDEGWWTDDTLGAMVARSIAAHPDRRVSAWSRSREWHGTYADIEREARRLVRLLVARGVHPGEVVGFQLPNWREAVTSFVGLSMGGYILVPIVHIYGRKEVSFILEQCGAAAYVSPASFGHVDYVEIVDRAAPPSLRLHVVAGEDPLAPSPSSRVRRIAWSEVETVDPADGLPTVDPRQPAVLAYTSGTTSDPKGVIHDHRTLLSELRHMSGMIVRGWSNLMASPVTHATGMLGAVLGPLDVGNEIHLIDRWDPGHALEVMAKASIGGGTGAALFLAGLLDHADFSPAHAANMARVGLGGAPIPPSLGERAAAHGISIIRAYGSTEHPSTTGSDFDDSPRMRHYTDGPPLASVEIRLVDEDGEEVGVGVPGEILSRGPDLCVGYTDPALNAAFDEDGWYRTGDVGVLDEDGCLTITDRVKDIIIRGGENVSAAEVEGALQTMAGVAEVAVVAEPDERLGEHGCAVLRMAPGADGIDLDAMRAHLETTGLARQKWPESIRIVSDFPRTAAGKIRKVDLRARLRDEAAGRKRA